MHIVSLSEVAQHLDTVAQWLWDEWRGGEAGQTFQETRAALLGFPGVPPTLVALAGEVPLGVLSFSRFTLRASEPSVLFINALFVAEAQRDRGIGSSLLAEALARVGAEDAFVYVYTGIPAWYQARGFAVYQPAGPTGNTVLRVRRPER